MGMAWYHTRNRREQLVRDKLSTDMVRLGGREAGTGRVSARDVPSHQDPR
jgi:hypothetical protein